jgi:hypothetical protein
MGVDLLPLNAVLVLLFDETDSFENVRYVVDAALLFDVQSVGGLK